MPVIDLLDGLAPYRSRVSTAKALPRSAAQDKGVLPSESARLMVLVDAKGSCSKLLDSGSNLSTILCRMENCRSSNQSPFSNIPSKAVTSLGSILFEQILFPVMSVTMLMDFSSVRNKGIEVDTSAAHDVTHMECCIAKFLGDVER